LAQRGLLRSQHGSNGGYVLAKPPEFITALHEESAVTMAHGYAKATGRPMVALLHGTIGVQHAAMSIYQCSNRF